MSLMSCKTKHFFLAAIAATFVIAPASRADDGDMELDYESQQPELMDNFDNTDSTAHKIERGPGADTTTPPPTIQELPHDLQSDDPAIVTERPGSNTLEVKPNPSKTQKPEPGIKVVSSLTETEIKQRQQDFLKDMDSKLNNLGNKIDKFEKDIQKGNPKVQALHSDLAQAKNYHRNLRTQVDRAKTLKGTAWEQARKSIVDDFLELNHTYVQTQKRYLSVR